MNVLHKRKGRKIGFTLIELLIVVAIIAILAAIAVPNFLEAQNRAKLTRVKSDMRTIGMALETYFLDEGTYPRDHDNDAWDGRYRWTAWNADRGQQQVGLFYLTTPIAYLTTLAKDPYSAMMMGATSDGNKKYSPYYVLGSGSDNDCFGKNRVHAFALICFGPDGTDQTGAEDFFPSNGEAIDMGNYDPTNGTKSEGDLYRFGGAYRSGDWRLWGIKWTQWGNVDTSMP